MFDTRGVQDTPAPSARTTALLEQTAAAMAELRRAQARVLDLVSDLDDAGAAAEVGHRSTARLLGEHLRIDARDARALVTDAGLIAPCPGLSGPPAPPTLPATAGHLHAGQIGREHLTVIATAVRALDRVTDLPPAVRDEAERCLAQLATIRSPTELRRDATDVLLLLDPDGQLAPDADRPTAELHLSTSSHGELSGRFRFADAETAEVIRTALDALTPPPDPDDDTTALHPGRTLPERRAAALHDLAADALGEQVDDAFAGLDTEAAESSAPGDEGRRRRPRTQGGDAVGLVVTMSLETLRGQVAGLGLLDGQWALRPETLRRLACDASVVPAVLGTRGEVLDLGRATRTVSTAQRRAVITRDRHCAHPGCRRRPRRCQVHHIIPWALAGPTDLDNLVLLWSTSGHTPALTT